MMEEPPPRLLSEDWSKIRKASMFASMREEDFRRIAANPRCETYRKGQTLFFEGEEARAFYLVLEGWVLLSRDRSDGTRTVIKLLGPGESFAEALVGETDHYPVSAEAAAGLRVACFDCAAFRALMMANPGLSLSMIAATFRQMRQLLDQIEHLKSWPAERRVANLLLDIGGNAGPGRHSFTLPVEQTLLAARLSISPPTFSRILKKLAHLGVEAKYGRITIHDRERLAAFAAETKD